MVFLQIELSLILIVILKKEDPINVAEVHPPPDAAAQNEIDSPAETSCASSSWIPLFFTGDTVSVHGFNGNQLDTSIPIATCATKLVTNSGIPCILVCLNGPSSE